MSDNFPPELIEKILLKLPIKSLICFTTVCKCWHSIITSTSFISSHLNNHPPNPTTLLLSRYDEHNNQQHFSVFEVDENKPFSINSSSDLDFPFITQNRCFRIVASCRGIICLCLSTTDLFLESKEPVVLWNPSIKRHVVLPKGTINPKKCHHVKLGFGVANHELKVVRLVCYPGFALRSPAEAEVFSLESGRWRRLGGDIRLQNVRSVWDQVILDGDVHWLSRHSVKDVLEYRERAYHSILVFRVALEVFDEINLPNELPEENQYIDLSLTLIEESLALIMYHGDWSNIACDVWLMKEYGVESSWTRLYSFLLGEGVEKVVAFMKSSEALVASWEIGLVAYDLENLEPKNLEIQGTTKSFHIENYVESLELLGVKSEIAEESSEGVED